MRRPGWLTLLGYDGTTVHLTGSRRTIAWRPGSAPVVVVRAGGLAVDVPHDTLFTFDARPGTYGPVTLSAPGAQAWSLPAGDFYPRTVSPDGTYVVGLGSNENHVQVRLMSDGSLVSDWKRHLAFDRPLVWEGADQWSRCCAQGGLGAAALHRRWRLRPCERHVRRPHEPALPGGVLPVIVHANRLP